MNCPVCNDPRAEECFEEVDIGVGVQKHTWGFACPVCGQIPVCSLCGGVGENHTRWCKDLQRKD